MKDSYINFTVTPSNSIVICCGSFPCNLVGSATVCTQKWRETARNHLLRLSKKPSRNSSRTTVVWRMFSSRWLRPISSHHRLQPLQSQQVRLCPRKTYPLFTLKVSKSNHRPPRKFDMGLPSSPRFCEDREYALISHPHTPVFPSLILFLLSMRMDKSLPLRPQRYFWSRPSKLHMTSGSTLSCHRTLYRPDVPLYDLLCKTRPNQHVLSSRIFTTSVLLRHIVMTSLSVNEDRQTTSLSKLP